MIKQILLIFLCIIGYYHLDAQTTKTLSKAEIDSVLNSQLNNQNKIDTLFSLDRQTKFYKKIFGFIRIKTGEGFTLDYTVFVNNKLFMYCEYSKKFNKRKIEEYDYEFYFIENRFVKYERLRILKKNNEKECKTIHKIDLYINGNEVIDKYEEINDNYNFAKINLEKVFQEASRIEKNSSILKPSS